VIAVLVAASSLVVRAGLEAVVEQTGEGVVAGSASSKDLAGRAFELHPDVILWQLSPDEDAGAVLHTLEGHRVIVLGADSPRELLRAGARGALPATASEDQIAAAIRAAAADLVVLPYESTTSPAVPQAASGLTARETEVLRMVAEGLANKEIAWRLGISEHTVKFHVSSVLGKLGAGSRAEAISAGIRQGAIML